MMTDQSLARWDATSVFALAWGTVDAVSAVVRGMCDHSQGIVASSIHHFQHGDSIARLTTAFPTLDWSCRVVQPISHAAVVNCDFATSLMDDKCS
jgi:hypothetical protein